MLRGRLIASNGNVRNVMKQIVCVTRGSEVLFHRDFREYGFKTIEGPKIRGVR